VDYKDFFSTNMQVRNVGVSRLDELQFKPHVNKKRITCIKTMWAVKIVYKAVVLFYSEGEALIPSQ